jgi:glycosyltransferase involved in cell wall biosynthesis
VKRDVLFANHTGELAGAEHSLLDLLDGLSGRAELSAACPPGELFDALRSRMIATTAIPETSVSFRPDPVHTPVGLAQLARAGMRLRRIARERGAAVVHANTERAGLSAALAGRIGGPPVVVHARAPFPDNRLGAVTARALERGTAAIIANSRFTARQFAHTGNDRIVEVIHNPVDGERFDPAKVDRAAARSALGIGASDPLLAVVGYIAPVKCQDDAIRILAKLRENHPGARLILAGGTRFTGASARADNAGYADGLRRLAAELGVSDDVMFVGEVEDVREVLAASDLLLVPSRQEGFGRVALEGMAMARAVIATSVGGTAEIVRDGVDGLLLEPGDPDAWADAAAGLLADEERRRDMGERGRERALTDFSPEAHVEGVLSVYERVLAGEAGAP